ncbi:MAG: cation-translocating P-type ATPase [Planctomycetota bacterium]|nr:MAG: cation-translocating P-type ATPase [Planctomycetota bacterium]
MPGLLRTTSDRLFSDEWQLPIALGAGVALLVGFSLQQLVDESFGRWAAGFHGAGHALVWVSLALGAVHGVKAAVESIRELEPNIDVLMVVGAGLAAIIGHPGEGALLLFMFTLAGALEHRALTRARDAVARLSTLMPNEALRRRDGAWVPAAPEELSPGDVVLVRPGEVIPADGVVQAGSSTIDQSTLTGESLPRPVDPGDAVYAGTLNENGALEVRVTRSIRESSLQRILDLVTEAQASRQPLQRVIDRFSTPYTLAVFAFAVLALVWFALLHERVTGQVMTLTDAAYRAITLLIVASPCALVIATPTVTLCGLNRAARAGLLVKGGDALERLAGVTVVALDKTGTLTTGEIAVTGFEVSDGSDADRLLSLALAVEERSTHPIAAAITRFILGRGIEPAALDDFEQVPGKGIRAQSGSVEIHIGTMEYVLPRVEDERMRRRIEGEVNRVRAEGGISAVLSAGEEAAVFSLADTPRPGAGRLVEDLRAAGVERVVMLTGDSRLVAERVARDLGIEEVHGELLPEEKVERLRAIKAEMNGRGRLAVVGDGVNDAPALATADIGLAMGGVGADAALETADVVVLRDDLRVVPWALALARRVRAVMYQNLIFAMLVIAALAVFALAGMIPMGVGVIGHEGSTLLVVANSLRLLGLGGPGRA